jgi:hypothetical protein
VRGVVISLSRFGLRLVVGFALALVLALLLALVRDDSSFAESLRIAVISVGGITLLLAFGGSSPSRRMDADPYLGYLFPKLHRRTGEQYSGAVLSTSAIFALVGAALIVFGFVLPV